ncbi:MAG TPA: ABC transporter permease [Candidatus Angelobacter sp.]
MKRRRRMLEDLDQDIREHLARETEDNIGRGMGPEEARSMALRKFGNVTRVKEDTREVWAFVWTEQLWQDIVYAFRMLRKSPAFTSVVVLTLALGIGANTAIFSVVQGVLLAPLPYFQSDRLVVLFESNPRFPRVWISYPNFQDWQRSARSFEQMAVFMGWKGFDLTDPGEPEHLDGKEISAGFFTTLGVNLARGREFTAQEDGAAGPPAVIISDRLWRNRFGGSPEAVGKSVTLNGVDYTIVGVAPPDFRLLGDADVYTPLGQGDPMIINHRATHAMWCIARLKPGASILQARAEMSTIQKGLDEQYPDANRDLGTDVTPLKEQIVGEVSGTLLLLLGAVGLVLLIACANVANLLLARSAARSREFAIRSALGANRSRVLRQLLTESVLLALAGGGLGLAVAAWGLNPVLAAVPGAVPRSQEIGLNVPVLLFAFGVAVGVGILFGMAPALKNSRAGLQDALKEGGRTSASGRGRVQSSLVIAQMALTLVLLVGAGLLLRTIRSLGQVDPGFDPRHLITFRVGVSHSLTKTVSGTRVAYQQLIERIRKVPGVQAADFTDVVPLSSDSDIMPFWIGSEKPASLQAAPRLQGLLTGPDYLRTMGIPLLRGRFFTDQDTTHSPCVWVIDSDLARMYFPNSDPLGQTLSVGFASMGPCIIVGVVGHVRHWGLDEPSTYPLGQAYLPIAQDPDQWVQSNYSGFSVMVRTPLEPTAVMPAIKNAVYGAGSDQPVYHLETMQQVVSDSMSSQRLPMVLLGAFAGLALLLASLGIYGVISYSVAQRVREIGIRMVLGAEKRDVFRMVIGQGLRLAVAGLAIGAVGALILTRLLPSFSSLLYGVRANDPLTFVAVSIILTGVAILACYIPARRATRVDPMVPLRCE